MDQQAETVVRRYFDAVNRGEREATIDLFADDAVQEWPGSEESMEGREGIGAVTRATPRLPAATIRRLRGSGPLVVCEWTANYGDGTPWHVVSIFEIDAGRITRKTEYFAAAVEPPAWRRGLTRRGRWPGQPA